MDKKKIFAIVMAIMVSATVWADDENKYNMEMTPEEHREFMLAQKEAIEVAKWLLGEKIGRDPGEEYILQWIKENAEEFRRNWPAYSAEWRASHNK